MPATPLATLRDRSAPAKAFRRASRAVTQRLVLQLRRRLRARKVADEEVVFVVILRAALAFLDAIVRAFPSSRIAVVGLRRDEETAAAHWYYANIPPLSRRDTVVILDPMLATGGSAEEAARKAVAFGADPKKMHFLGVLAAPEGVRRIARVLPRRNIVVAKVDRGLDARKFIVPGLGDYGDRYFGT